MIRAREDERMASKFEAKAAPIRHQLDLLLDEREKQTTQLEQTKESLDAAAAELNTFRNQYNEAKDIVAADREEKDKIARACSEPYRYASGMYYFPTSLTLNNLYLITLLQYLTAPTPRLKPVQ
ncbi:hypothetical protein F5883DRAFT_524080 [Diaporthe sp. PMI_573]|nr:hypothetical protein F5883DRAFT_524080 [Diaporthaceae sp. PMI_573]